MLNLFNLKKITVVIITYNRHIYLKRTLNYWLNYDIKVLILDGTIKKFEDPILQEKNIKYIHDPRSVNRRFLNSINYIDTEFMVVSADDEFYLPSALSTCVDFLSMDESYSSCGGRAVGFLTKEKKILGVRQYPKLRDLCLDNDNASDRIIKHFSAYVPAHYYSVVRVNKWKIICLNVFQKKYNFYASFEMQIEFLIMVSGKSKIISNLMWMRNNEVPRLDTELETPIETWWYDKKYEFEKLNFLEKMKKGCKELSQDQNSFLNEENISKLFEVHIKKILEYRKKNIFRKFLNLLPYELETKLLKLVKKWYRISTGEQNSLDDEINILEKEGVTVNHEELELITSFIHNSKNDN